MRCEGTLRDQLMLRALEILKVKSNISLRPGAESIEAGQVGWRTTTIIGFA
jgi:hypothetical protein